MPKSSISFEIKRTYINVRRYIESHAKNCSMENKTTDNQRRIMAFLFESGGSHVFQKDIENHFGISSPTCSKTLTLLEKNGYIKRVLNPNDARQKHIVLTAKAEACLLRAYQHMDEIDKSIVNNIDEEKIEIFLEVLAQINENVKKGMKDD